MSPLSAFERRHELSPSRRILLSITMWIFGISTTLLLVGFWGRAVTIDQATVTETAQAVVDAEVARDRMYDWIEDAVAGSQSVGSAEAGELIAGIRNRPEMSMAIDNVIGAFVGALFTPQGESAVIDLETAIAPAVPIIVEQLSERDLPVDQVALVSALGDAAAIELDTEGAVGIASTMTDARTFVTRVVVLAFLTMMLSGAAALMIAKQRFVMLRTLSLRVLLSALSFAVLFRLGAWALDPNGGRSPIATGGSIVLGSNGHVFMIIAAIAAVVGGFGAWAAWRRRNRPLDDEITIEMFLGSRDDDTRELVSV